jgi:tetratricopeptide (TPR) repeat protein
MSTLKRLKPSRAALIVLVIAAPLLAQDTVTLNQRTRRGSKVLGTIKNVSETEVLVSANGIDRKIPVNEIQRIGLGGEPTGLRQGRSAIFSGQYEQALESLETVRLDASASPVLRQEVEFYRAAALANLALRGSGDPKDAASLLLSFVKRNRNSFHFYEAVELLGDLTLMVGSYENASLYYRQIAKAPFPEYVLRSSVLEGNALRAQGKFKEAIERYSKALSTSASDPESLRQQAIARIGKAACMAETGKVDEALAEIDEIIAKNDASDDQLFALAYLAQGTAHRKAQRDLDAVMAYLHVDLLFFNQRDAHAEALYYLGELWPKVNNPDRGVEARNLLKSRYGSTSWAKL